ncbi:hypothetical protein [Aquimarina sp. 2201CG5-10]|uniref:hypothetical protein n=1 Tax=Aquimarina callyspongiae TaxID=3098150 RepID=UPI002AB3353D|nr:hypothetical protein [Aquimarina sp. 2201CG5-10]MDY8138978.1 hypothetical protein [Aquimarina sp. 2201CG5-10]
MKKLLFISLFTLFLTSCDDGDIIVTSFEFDDASLELCEGSQTNEFVFFKINTTVNEAISYNFIDDTFSDIQETSDPINITLDGTTNALVYRQFNNSITADYYCSNIPPSSIIVTQELISSEGIATITVEITEEDDNDGVISLNQDTTITLEDEDLNDDGNLENDDTDADGIPNYKDQDDDNDNILTSVELPNSDPNDSSFLDTDGDGIPNYRDADDDNDGILTINEDLDNNGNPRDDDYDGDGIPNYLDPDDDDDGINTIDEDTNGDDNPQNDDDDNDGIFNYLDTDSASDQIIGVLDITPSLDNTVQTTFRTSVRIDNIMFPDNGDNFMEDNFSFGFKDRTISITN